MASAAPVPASAATDYFHDSSHWASWDVGRPDLTIAPNGEIYVVWKDFSDGTEDIYLARLDADLNLLAGLIKVSDGASGSRSNPVVTVDATGVVHVAWADHRTSYNHIYVDQATAPSFAFGTDLLLDTHDEASHPAIASTGDEVVVAYQGNDFDASRWTVWAARHLNGGSWEPPHRVRDAAADATDDIDPDLVHCGPSSEVCVTWTDYRNGNPDLFFDVSFDGGALFGTDKAIRTSSYDEQQSSLAIDSAGTLYATYTVWVNGFASIEAVRSLDFGDNWSSPIPMDDAGSDTNQMCSTAAGGQDGHLYVAFEDNRDNGFHHVYFAKTTGWAGGAGPNRRVDDGDDGYVAREPALALSATGRAYVAWRVSDGADWDIAATSSAGSPTSAMTLKPTLNTIPADGVSTTDISSNAITDDWGIRVLNGTPITVDTSLGSIASADVDTASGTQVGTRDGMIVFTLRSATTVGNAQVSAQSLAGSASGNTTVAFSGFTIGGTISGLAAGNSVTLQNNGGDTLVRSSNGTFAFGTPLASGDGYLVAVSSQPTSPSQTCTVSNESGTVANNNVNDVVVSCASNPIYQVTPSAGSNGAISPDSVQTVPANGSIDFTVSPDNGYRAIVGGTCPGALNGTLYSAGPIVGDCSVVASFEPSSSTELAFAAPTRLGQSTLFTVQVTGVGSAPLDGQIEVSTNTAETCSSTARTISGNTANFTCTITFGSAGPRSVSANFTGSTTHSASSSTVMPLTVMHFANLSVTVDDAANTAVSGSRIDYVVEVLNAGPDAAPGTGLTSAGTPPLEQPDWICVVPAGSAATCPGNSGSGSAPPEFDLAAGSRLDFLLGGTLPTMLPAEVVFDVAVRAANDAPNFVHDPQLSDNLASDRNAVPGIFSDGFEFQPAAAQLRLP